MLGLLTTLNRTIFVLHRRFVRAPQSMFTCIDIVRSNLVVTHTPPGGSDGSAKVFSSREVMEADDIFGEVTGFPRALAWNAQDNRLAVAVEQAAEEPPVISLYSVKCLPVVHATLQACFRP